MVDTYHVQAVATVIHECDCPLCWHSGEEYTESVDQDIEAESNTDAIKKAQQWVNAQADVGFEFDSWIGEPLVELADVPECVLMRKIGAPVLPGLEAW
jgi:hypothetical protein